MDGNANIANIGWQNCPIFSFCREWQIRDNLPDFYIPFVWGIFGYFEHFFRFSTRYFSIYLKNICGAFKRATEVLPATMSENALTDIYPILLSFQNFLLNQKMKKSRSQKSRATVYFNQLIVNSVLSSLCESRARGLSWIISTATISKT